MSEKGPSSIVNSVLGFFEGKGFLGTGGNSDSQEEEKKEYNSA